MQKKITKIIVLLATVLMIFSLTGCGFAFGKSGDILAMGEGAYDENKGKGTHVRVDETESPFQDDNAMMKRDVFVSQAQLKSNSIQALIAPENSIAIPITHSLVHVCAKLVGATDTCAYADKCVVQKLSLTLDPLSLIDKTIEITNELTIELGLEGIAIAVLVAIWSANFLTQVIQERFTMESLLKGLCQLIVGVLLIQNANLLFSELLKVNASTGLKLNFGNGAIADHNAWFSFGLGLNIPIVQAGVPLFYFFIDNIPNDILNAAACILVFTSSIQLVTQTCTAIIPLIIEAKIRLQAAPIMFALTPQTGWGHGTIAYIKACLGCACSIPIMILIINEFPQAIVGFFSAGDSVFLSGLAYMLAYKVLAGLVGQIPGIVKGVFSH